MSECVNEAVRKAAEEIDDNGVDPNQLSLESLVLLINTQRLESLQTKTKDEFTELKDRQKDVAELHKILKAINAATSSKGDFDCSGDENLQQLLEKANQLGVDVKERKRKFNQEETERLIENIRVSIDDLNVQNDMQLQTVSRLTNERYECYQMARSILKPLHDAKTAPARGIKGG